tara:strand:- start:583 stop:1080 length:498 start_codon:yes stop_codon:yes gene_type:complete
MNEETLETIFRTSGTTLSVVPFKSYLLNIMDLQEHDKKHLKEMPNYSQYLDFAAENGYGYAVLDGGKPMLCFGVSPQWYGVAELWMIPDTKLVSKNRIKFHRGAKKFMELIMEELNLHRIHVTVLSSNIKAIKWIESISFQREGVLRKYTFDKKDMIIYSKMRKD